MWSYAYRGYILSSTVDGTVEITDENSFRLCATVASESAAIELIDIWCEI